MSSTALHAEASQAEQLLGQVDAYVSALKQLPSNQKFSPESLEAIYSLAYQQMQHGRIKQARNYLSLLLVYAPTNVRYLSAMAHCCEADGDSDQAIQMYSLALYIAPESCQLAVALAESLMRRGARDAAMQIFKMVARLATSPSERVYRSRAELWLQTVDADTTAKMH